MSFDHRKYRPAPVIALADRQWPNRVLERAPLVIDIDRDESILYLHVIGVNSDADVEAQRRVRGLDAVDELR